jgi:hypothetical protein
MDTSLLERMAKLRGIADAYYDYQGELRHFSLKTKTDLLRSMGCKVDDPVAMAAELSQLEILRWRQLLPPVAAARGPRIGASLWGNSGVDRESGGWKPPRRGGEHRRLS